MQNSPNTDYQVGEKNRKTKINNNIQENKISGKKQFAYFPYIRHLFEVREPNLLELNLSDLTLTSIQFDLIEPN
jgi:hypothetical protein